MKTRSVRQKSPHEADVKDKKVIAEKEIKIIVGTEGLDEAIEKANRLAELLREIQKSIYNIRQ